MYNYLSSERDGIPSLPDSFFRKSSTLIKYNDIHNVPCTAIYYSTMEDLVSLESRGAASFQCTNWRLHKSDLVYLRVIRNPIHGGPFYGNNEIFIVIKLKVNETSCFLLIFFLFQTASCVSP